ncbi:hypothetical protein [uncultured Brevundimonas sp.]|uniref:hypothetical protein n=1 Tax=uncultured Brevundimonas sp. TaxID=213418 RepID=UPI002632CDAD|nr:hypothetical protein [uncultured Brevundimonas sp.]
MSDAPKIPSTEPNAQPDGVPEPFARKQVTWGRMPATTFHVGPVPVAPNPLDRIPNRPPLKTPLGQGQGQGLGQGQNPLEGSLQPRRATPAPRPGGSILGGSLIPQARPGAGPLPTPPKPAPQPAPAAADLTVRPLPGAEPSPPEPIVERSTAPVVETPQVEAPQVQAPLVEPVAPSVARAPAKRPSRLPLYVGAGVLAVLVLGGGLWFALRPSPTPVTPSAPPTETVTPAVAAPVVETPQPVPAVEPAPVETTPEADAPVAPAREAATAPARTTPAPRTQTPTQNQTQAPVVATPQPAPLIVETAPLVIVPPAPTAARPAQTDPDAPVVTRPQPLD